jgi:hypothetical protein
MAIPFIGKTIVQHSRGIERINGSYTIQQDMKAVLWYLLAASTHHFKALEVRLK